MWKMKRDIPDVTTSYNVCACNYTVSSCAAGNVARRHVFGGQWFGAITLYGWVQASTITVRPAAALTNDRNVAVRSHLAPYHGTSIGTRGRGAVAKRRRPFEFRWGWEWVLMNESRLERADGMSRCESEDQIRSECGCAKLRCINRLRLKVGDVTETFLRTLRLGTGCFSSDEQHVSRPGHRPTSHFP